MVADVEYFITVTGEFSIRNCLRDAEELAMAQKTRKSSLLVLTNTLIGIFYLHSQGRRTGTRTRVRDQNFFSEWSPEEERNI